MRVSAIFGLIISTALAHADERDVISQLVRDLETPAKRIAALDQIAELGPAAKEALPPLLELLQKKDHELQIHTGLALGRIGKAAVEPVGKLLGHEDAQVRMYVAWTLGLIGPDAKEVLPALVSALAKAPAEVRQKIGYALGRISPDSAESIHGLAELLSDTNADTRSIAEDSLKRSGTAAVVPLVKGLEAASTPTGKQTIARVLGGIGAEAATAIPALKNELFREKSVGPRQPYAEALAKIGKASVPVLAEGLKDDRADVRSASIHALGQINPEGAPILVDALGHKSAEVRRDAVHALREMRVGDKMVVLGFAFCLNDEVIDNRLLALGALQNLGPTGQLAAAAVATALTDGDPRVRQQAFFTLAALGVNPREGVVKALAHKDERIRFNAAALAVAQHLNIPEANDYLIQALKHANPEFRLTAAITLADLPHTSPQAKDAMAALIGVLDDENPKLRQQAIRTLGKYGLIAQPILEAQLLKARDSGARSEILWSLRASGYHSKTGLASLLACLQDPQPSVRWQAAFILANFGPDASDAASQLRNLTKDSDRLVQFYAQRALERIEKK